LFYNWGLDGNAPTSGHASWWGTVLMFTTPIRYAGKTVPDTDKIPVVIHLLQHNQNPSGLAQGDLLRMLIFER